MNATVAFLDCLHKLIFKDDRCFYVANSTCCTALSLSAINCVCTGWISTASYPR
jgi:hypothetical protein